MKRILLAAALVASVAFPALVRPDDMSDPVPREGNMTRLAISTAFAQEARVRPQAPVIIYSADGRDACANGRVHGLDPSGDGFLAVKGGPGLKYNRIDKLYNGEEVYLCVATGDWFGVVYTKTRQDCNVSTPWPRSLPYTGPCRSGWVHRRWVEVTAG
jgi:hypothetical protein